METRVKGLFGMLPQKQKTIQKPNSQNIISQSQKLQKTLSKVFQMSRLILGSLFRPVILVAILLILPAIAFADNHEQGFLPIPPIPGIDDTQEVSVLVQIIYLITFLTFIPAVVMLMTCFTRIVIILSFLKMALGTQTQPPATVLVMVALALTFFVMTPTLRDINNNAVVPWLREDIGFYEMVERSIVPMREFMLAQTPINELNTFIVLSGESPKTVDDISLLVVTLGYITSELKVAFQVGFLLYLPFIIIDFIVASVLLSMGMMMLPPMMVSLPFKLMLFVLVDGWSLIFGSILRGIVY